MEERLIVKNFGPLKDVDIPLKDVMVFIGPQGSGKSTIAKLLNVMDDDRLDASLETVKSLFATNDIKWLKDNTYFNFVNKFLTIKIEKLHYSHLSKLGSINPFVLNDFILYNFKSRSALFNADIKIPIKKDELQIKVFLESTKVTLHYLHVAILNVLKVFEENNTGFDIDKLLTFIDFAQNAMDWIDVELKSNLAHAYLDEQVFNLSIALEEFLDYLVKKITPTFPVYFPAERISLPWIMGSIFKFNRYEIPMPAGLIAFGSEFETARQMSESYYDPISGVKYEYDGTEDRIFFSDKDFIKLTEAASGIQTLIPMLTVINYRVDRYPKDTLFIIEEPELNLYPSAQKKLVDFLVRKCTKGNNKLIITTHSPYILTALNNHIEAAEAAKNEKVSSEEVEKIMPKDSWLDFDRVGAWYVDKGICRDIMDKDEKLIAGENIDDVSTSIMDEFQKLVHLKYKE